MSANLTIEDFENDIRQWRCQEKLSLSQIAKKLTDLGLPDMNRNKVDRFCTKAGIPAPEQPVAGDGPQILDKPLADSRPVVPPPPPPSSGITVYSGNITIVPAPVVAPQPMTMPAGLFQPAAPRVERPAPAAAPAQAAVPVAAKPHVTQVVAVRRKPAAEMPLHPHKDKVVNAIFAGLVLDDIYRTMTEVHGLKVSLAETKDYAEALLDEMFARGTIQPELRRIPEPSREWQDDQALIYFGEGNRDPLRFGDLYGNVAVFGRPGSGKTSGSGYWLLASLFREGCGALLLTTKVGEAMELLTMACMAGRAIDTTVVRAGGYLGLNCLEYLQTQLAGVNLTETIVEFIMTLGSTYSGGVGKVGDEGFWGSSLRDHLRWLVELFRLAKAAISFDAIGQAAAGVPLKPADAMDTALPTLPYIGNLIKAADANSRSNAEDRRLYELVVEHLRSFAGLAQNTRSCITQALESLLSALRTPSIQRVIAGRSNLTPEAIFGGAIVILDLSPIALGEAGRLAQAAWKYVFQRAVLQRADAGWGAKMRPVVLYADEAQEHLSSFDSSYMRLSRQYRCVSIYLTQTVANYIERLGGDRVADAKVNALLGAMNVRIFHANACGDTARLAMDAIGTEQKTVIETSETPSICPSLNPLKQFWHSLTSEPTVTTNKRVVRENVIHAHDFAALQPGTKSNGWVCEAILVQVGRTFSNGKRYLRVRFQQMLLPRFEDVRKYMPGQ